MPSMHVPPDDLISLAEAAKLIPPYRAGRKVHVSTLKRWGMKGKITLFACNGWKVSATEIKAKFRPRRV